MAEASQETERTGHARFTYRLRVSSTAQTKLLGEWDRCRWIWNECTARSKKARAEDEKCGPARLDRMLTEARNRNTWLGDGSSVPQQQLVRDFGKSRTKALKDIQARLPMRQRAGPSSVRIYRDSLGHWYASFVVATEAQPFPDTGAVIGIDWGVRETATTTSDAHDLPHAEHGKKAAVRLAHYQRMMARRKPAKGKPGSRGYRTAKRLTAKLHKKTARQRRDTGLKWAKSVVRDYDALAVEDFRPKFLAKSTMARKAADAAIAATKTALITMARKHGRIVHLVHPAHTTMDCARCGARTKHALPPSERTYTCTACGAVSPRDKNSAHVMLVRAGLNPAGADRGRPAGPPGRQAA
ncbi:RNA-guided endonuclease InsQ/TnpB family protein [Streptomyces sp. NBC_01244]|uniref:RNA-guided endonuclease InsQ/TnpB family protein n=1 Tax=Streptomyces sp. NBC_01244 TaxID=2903797 RepID=UPI002E0E0073|nr:RNA-guided endonuclease TnpB family protein [Streptomyces sp. NBC_01244]